MTAGRWKLIETLFDQAVEVQPDALSAWLDAHCPDTELRAEVEGLLAADAATVDIERSVKGAVGLLAENVKARETPKPGKTIGPYEILAEVGRGGMGTVFRARRNDGVFAKEVAIKVVTRATLSEQILARFRRERQILARLDHPHIARVLDGGSTEGGIYYLVMDYVHGLPLTVHCNRHKLGLRPRLELFLKICHAVQYAHQQMVVHRDLKPGNILVDEAGEPKLLDFGIAKLLDPDSAVTTLTVDDVRPLTPQYASPEQVRGEDITAASDIYSLGALLYELVAGRPAYQVPTNSPIEFAYAICETEAAPPSQTEPPVDFPVQRQDLRGDVDNIVAMALQKDPRHRYGSAHQFADDIRRYLEFLPVRARAQTISYRAAKYVRRHRASLAAGVLTAASLIGGVIVANHQASRAERRAEQLRRLASAIVFEVHDALAKLPGAVEARKLLLTKAVEQMETLRKESDDPIVRFELASAFRRIGDSMGGPRRANLGDRAAAAKYYGEARQMLEASLAARPSWADAKVELAEVLAAQGSLESYSGDRVKALEIYRKGIAVCDGLSLASLGIDARGICAVLHTDVSDELRSTGQSAEALRHSEKAAAIVRDAGPAFEKDTRWRIERGAVLASLAKSRNRTGDLPGALAAARESAAAFEQVVAADRYDERARQHLMFAHGHTGDILGWPGNANLGDRAGAEQAYRKSVKIAEEVHASDPRNKRPALDLAIALTRLGNVIDPARGGEALETYGRSEALFERVLAEDPGLAVARWNLAYCRRMRAGRLFDAGSTDAALADLQRVEDSLRGALVQKPGDVTSDRMLVGALDDRTKLLLRTGRKAEASTAAARMLEYVTAGLERRSGYYRGQTRAAAYRGMASTRDGPETCVWYRRSLSAYEEIKDDPQSETPELKADFQAVRRAVAACPPER